MLSEMLSNDCSREVKIYFLNKNCIRNIKLKYRSIRSINVINLKFNPFILFYLLYFINFKNRCYYLILINNKIMFIK